MEVVESLLAAGALVDCATAKDGCTPLLTAAQEGHLEVVELLLRAGAEVDRVGHSRAPHGQ